MLSLSLSGGCGGGVARRKGETPFVKRLAAGRGELHPHATFEPFCAW